MSKLEEAIERIKKLECPTGDLGLRVAGILQDYKVANSNEVELKRDERFDKDGAEGFSTEIPNNQGESMIVLAISGSEDYVAKVVDVYIR